MNILTIGGRLGVDPEVRFTSNGQKVTTLRVAVNIRKSGKDETIWYRVTIWGENFDKMVSFLKKGSALIIVGDLAKPEIYTDREGKPQVSLNITASSIQFSPFGRSDKAENTSDKAENTSVSIEKPQSQNTGEKTQEYAGFATGAKKEESQKQEELTDDEIPF